MKLVQGRWKDYGHSHSRFQQFTCKLCSLLNNYLGAWWFTDAIVFLYIRAILIGKYFSRQSKKHGQTRGGVLQLSSVPLSILRIYDLRHLSMCKSVVNYLAIAVLDY